MNEIGAVGADDGAVCALAHVRHALVQACCVEVDHRSHADDAGDPAFRHERLGEGHRPAAAVVAGRLDVDAGVVFRPEKDATALLDHVGEPWLDGVIDADEIEPVDGHPGLRRA